MYWGSRSELGQQGVSFLPVLSGRQSPKWWPDLQTWDFQFFALLTILVPGSILINLASSRLFESTVSEHKGKNYQGSSWRVHSQLINKIEWQSKQFWSMSKPLSDWDPLTGSLQPLEGHPHEREPSRACHWSEDGNERTLLGVNLKGRDSHGAVEGISSLEHLYHFYL